MNWRVYQRIFELTAILSMIVGLGLMWMHKDPLHFLVYSGFMLVSTGKLIEAFNVKDESFRILKIVLCLSIYVLVLMNFIYNIPSLPYALLVLVIYWFLHYRLIFQQKRI